MSRQVAEVPAEAATEATPEAGIEIVVSWDIAKLDSSNSDIRKFDAAFFFSGSWCELMGLNGIEMAKFVNITPLTMVYANYSV